MVDLGIIMTSIPNSDIDTGSGGENWAASQGEASQEQRSENP